MVKVEILSVEKNDTDNSNEISYRVSNFYDRDIFLVADDWFTWNYNDFLIEISFARTKMVEGVTVFGYFLPLLQKIKPEGTVEKKIHLKWPQRLDTIWNKQKYANPEKGANKLKIIIGYGFSKKIEESDSLSTEENIKNWQVISESNECSINI